MGSKNVEATGERDDSYDRWRPPGLPFLPLRYLEYTRGPGQTGRVWPLFDLHCVVHPVVLGQTDAPSNNQVLRELKERRDELTMFAQVARQAVTLPFYVAVANETMSHFNVQVIPRLGRGPQIVEARTFVSDIIRQTWAPDDTRPLARGRGAPDGSGLQYSAWHRKKLSPSSLVMDIDYVEFRRDTSVAIIEATRANSDDLVMATFAFVSRGFAQIAVMLQMGEMLGIPAYLVAHLRDLIRFGVLPLSREIVEWSDDVDRQRKRITAEEAKTQDWRTAQGIATSRVFEDRDAEYRRVLERAGYFELDAGDYRRWLEDLGEDVKSEQD